MAVGLNGSGPQGVTGASIDLSQNAQFQALLNEEKGETAVLARAIAMTLMQMGYGQLLQANLQSQGTRTTVWTEVNKRGGAPANMATGTTNNNF